MIFKYFCLFNYNIIRMINQTQHIYIITQFRNYEALILYYNFKYCVAIFIIVVDYMSQIEIDHLHINLKYIRFYKMRYASTINYVNIAMQLIYCSTSITCIDTVFSRNLSIFNVQCMLCFFKPITFFHIKYHSNTLLFIFLSNKFHFSQAVHRQCHNITFCVLK